MTTITAERAPTAEKKPKKKSLLGRTIDSVQNFHTKMKQERAAKEPYLRAIALDRARLIAARNKLRAAYVTGMPFKALKQAYYTERRQHESLLFRYHIKFSPLDAEIKMKRFRALEDSKLESGVIHTFGKDKHGKARELSWGHVWRGAALGTAGSAVVAVAVLVHGVNALWRLPLGVGVGIGMNILLKKYGIFDFLKKDIEEGLQKQIVEARGLFEKGEVTYAEYAVKYSTLIKQHRLSRAARQWFRRGISALVGVGAYTYGGDTIAGLIGEGAADLSQWAVGASAHAQEVTPDLSVGSVDTLPHKDVSSETKSTASDVSGDEKPRSSDAKMGEGAAESTVPAPWELRTLGTSPVCETRECAFGKIESVADDMISKGTLPAEFRAAFIEAHRAWALEDPVYSDDPERRYLQPNETLASMAFGRADGSVGSIGDTERGVRFTGAVDYVVERRSFEVMGSDGNLYRVNMVIPEICFNFSISSIEIIETPEAPPSIPVIVAEAPEACPPIPRNAEVQEAYTNVTTMVRRVVDINTGDEVGRSTTSLAPFSYAVTHSSAENLASFIGAQVPPEFLQQIISDGAFEGGRPFAMIHIVAEVDGCMEIVRVFCIDRLGNILELTARIPTGTLSTEVVLSEGTRIPRGSIQLPDGGELPIRGRTLTNEFALPRGTVINGEIATKVVTQRQLESLLQFIPR